MKAHGKFNMQAHRTGSGVVMDIAAFKVSHCVGIDATDVHATTLRAGRARSKLHRAMDASSGENQHASTPNR
jgi:hypothetical protein